MVKNNNKQSGADLLNFHFSSPPSQQHQRQNGPPRRLNSNNGGNGNRRNNNRTGQPRQSNSNRNQQKQYQRTKEDRASARQRASGQMFPLHSSPDHAFNISRRPSRHQASSSSPYSFHGCDEPVSWDSVRSVKYFAAAHEQERCPICLDSFVVS